MRLTINLNEYLVQQLKNISENYKQSVSSVASNAIEFYLKKIKKESAVNNLLKISGTQKLDNEIIKNIEKERHIDDEDRI